MHFFRNFGIASIGSLVSALILLPITSYAAADLRQATVKEVVNDVKIVPAGQSTGTQAQINGLFKSPDVIRTGSQSRAELIAADQTVTRVGANTVFSFEPTGRQINLQQGSVLFHAPSGRGGGTIQTAAATAAVTGTTLIVAATRNGGFKVIVLEGKSRVQLPNGKRVDLLAGQLSFILPGSRNLTPPITFRLDTLVKGSRMLKGFSTKLASQDKIEKEISQQEKTVVAETGLEIGDFATDQGMEIIDLNTLSAQVQDNANNFQLALQTDATITGSTLDSSRIFDLDRIFSELGIHSGSSSSSPPSDFAIFLGRNIDFKTGSLTIPSVTDFGFFADHNLTIHQSIDFLGGGENLFFQAGNDIIINGSLTFQSDFVDFDAENNFQANVATISAPNGFFVFAGNQLDIFGQTGVNNTINAPFVALEASTVILTKFDFNTTTQYIVGTQTGNWNSQILGQPIIPGQFNIRGGTINGGIMGTGAGGPGSLNTLGLPNVFSFQQ